jgi:protein-tyrosine phosphatase
MAESVMTHLIDINGVKGFFNITSSATSREEIGNPPHPGTVEILKKHKIAIVPHSAIQITRDDANDADFLIVMDQNNIYNLKRLIDKQDYPKIYLLLSYAGFKRAIADPWYTGDFDVTYQDVILGCKELLKSLIPTLDSASK